LAEIEPRSSRARDGVLYEARVCGVLTLPLGRLFSVARISDNRLIMATPSTTDALAGTVFSFVLPAYAIQERTRQIHQAVLAHSRYLRYADFTAIHPEDLEFLFDAYDERFLTGNCRLALNGRRIRFRVSPRMTSAGGKTTRFIARTGEVHYEIAIAGSMLFDYFRNTDRRTSVGGIDCENRLEALQRIYEHELLHLVELLCWDTSNCRAERFQDIARRLFLHQAHTHSLITRRERAAESGIRPGSRVSFEFEGLRLKGRVNRVTKRATVLVEEPSSQKYSDGLRYRTYYVPIGRLLAE
jgi:hypothetical protein